jgi:hypothetical protein
MPSEEEAEKRWRDYWAGIMKVLPALKAMYPFLFPPNDWPPSQKKKQDKKRRKPHYDWNDADTLALKWLKDNGTPIPKSGEQARLEEEMKKAFAGKRRCPSESTVRERALKCIEEYKAKQKAG